MNDGEQGTITWWTAVAKINDEMEQGSTSVVGNKWITMSDKEESGARLGKF